jgi:hypothetical protein
MFIEPLSINAHLGWMNPPMPIEKYGPAPESSMKLLSCHPTPALSIPVVPTRGGSRCSSGDAAKADALGVLDRSTHPTIAARRTQRRSAGPT